MIYWTMRWSCVIVRFTSQLLYISYISNISVANQYELDWLHWPCIARLWASRRILSSFSSYLSRLASSWSAMRAFLDSIRESSWNLSFLSNLRSLFETDPSSHYIYNLRYKSLCRWPHPGNFVKHLGFGTVNICQTAHVLRAPKSSINRILCANATVDKCSPITKLLRAEKSALIQSWDALFKV